MKAVRLHVLLARAGIASRRRAEVYIREGRVTVDGKVIRELGTKVDPTAEIAVDGKRVSESEPLVTIVLAKPDSVMTTLSDPEGRETVADLVAAEPYKLRPVGRLDYHTEGVLLMTTDGELANRLMHPRHHVPKTYLVKVRGRPTERALERLRAGVTLDDGPARPVTVEVAERGPRDTWLEIIVTEGRKHLVRRLAEHVGYPALRVVRTMIGAIGLGDLRPGEYRYLTPRELEGLYRMVGLARPPRRPDGEEAAERSVRSKLGRARRRKGLLPGEKRARKSKGKRSRAGARSAQASSRG